MTRLAALRPDGYVLLDDLCWGMDLPRHFVAKIFQDLVRKGLLTSAKGRGGGFALACKPTRIYLFDIVEVMDGLDQLDPCVVGMARCNDKQPCPQHKAWSLIRNQAKHYLERTTLQSMANTLNRKMNLIGRALPNLQSKSKPVRVL